MSEQPAERTEWIRRVLRDHEAPLLRYAIRLTGDAETARDIVQETLLRLCRADAKTIDGHVGPWLFRVCRQRAIDQQRKEQRMPIMANNALETCPAQAPSPAEQSENDEQGQDILRLLTTLSAHQQEVVRLKFQAGLGYRQIAEVTGLTVTNVGYLLHTALAILRERLTPAAELPAPKVAPPKISGLKASGSHEADQPTHEQSGRKG
ncbi:MAG TPA: sigma-70 family RNA polymerase sigma factor [Pirellulales bacterium]|jgi:RNA polymerase sigma-70 factor (ECF subfamily)